MYGFSFQSLLLIRKLCCRKETAKQIVFISRFESITMYTDRFDHDTSTSRTYFVNFAAFPVSMTLNLT